ncbi:MAG: TonB-dependent receptor, partial [Gemmatimonadales bacterium]|nr:TonB-dependent receptor [Gemmatimonadales bacterium]
PTLEQVLRQLPLFHVRRNSRGEAEISARGSESRQVAVLIDGVPVTLAWDARTDASVLPATGIRDLTYTRGLSSMLYGPNVLGGIIELGVGQSSYRPRTPAMEFNTGIDHVGGFGSSATVAVPIQNRGGRWLVRGGAGFRDSPGVPLAKGITEPVATHDDLRVNTDAKNTDGFAAVRYEGNGGGWFALSGSTFNAERGIAAELGYDDARFWRYPHVSRTIAVLSGGTGGRRSPFGGTAGVEASFGLDLGRTDIDAYTTREYTELDAFENGKDRTSTIRLRANQTLGGRGELRTAFTRSETRHDEFLPAGEARYRQQLMSIGGETTWRLIENGAKLNALRLTVGGAYDQAETPESGGREPRQGRLSEWGARVGMTAVLADGKLVAHGGVSRRGRFPALRELYSGALNRFTPNPDLKPENLVAVEAGLTARMGESTEVQVVGFRHRMNDAVVRITLPNNRFMRVNRNRLESTGLEVMAATVIGRLGIRGDLTMQSVDLTNTGAGTTSRPENLPDLFGGVNATLELPWNLQAGAEVRYTGKQFCIDPASGDDAELASGAVVSADLSKQWRIRSSGNGWLSRLEARITVDNVGNKAMYDQCRLPEAGRLARVQIRLF